MKTFALLFLAVLAALIALRMWDAYGIAAIVIALALLLLGRSIYRWIYSPSRAYAQWMAELAANPTGNIGDFKSWLGKQQGRPASGTKSARRTQDR